MAIYAKLLNVMKQVKRVPKNGYNSFHKYKYVQESDLVEYLREKLAEEGLLIVPSAESQTVVPQGDNALTLLEMTMTVVDVESGETLALKWQGQGQDKGDKGLYKAFTGAQKYFLMKTFMVPTGDDPERDETETTKTETKTKPQENKLNPLYAAAAKLNITREQLDMALISSPDLNIDTVDDLTPDQINQFIKIAREKPASFRKAVFGDDKHGGTSERAAS